MGEGGGFHYIFTCTTKEEDQPVCLTSQKYRTSILISTLQDHLLEIK